jgi:hypothetical protein
MSCVFDDDQPVPARQRKHGIHVACMATIMDRNNCLGLLRDYLLCGANIDVQVISTAINEYGSGPHVEDDFTGCTKRHCWDEYFIAAPNAARFK